MNYEEKEKIVVEYAKKHEAMSAAAIARELGFGKRSVQEILKKNGLARSVTGLLIPPKKAKPVVKKSSEVEKNALKKVKKDAKKADESKKKEESANAESKVEKKAACAVEKPKKSKGKSVKAETGDVASHAEDIKRNIQELENSKEPSKDKAAHAVAEVESAYAEGKVKKKSDKAEKKAESKPEIKVELDKAFSERVMTEKEKIVTDYAREHADMSAAAISRELGYSARSVQDILKRHGLSRKVNGAPSKPKVSEVKVEGVGGIDKKSSAAGEKASKEAGEGNQVVETLNRGFEALKNRVLKDKVKKDAEVKQEEVEVDKPTEKAVEKAAAPSGERRVVVHDAWGGHRRKRTVDLHRMNTWSFGGRLSPKMLRKVRESFDFPEEYVDLIAYSDGASPVKDTFTVKLNSGMNTFKLQYLLPMVDLLKEGNVTLEQANPFILNTCYFQ